MRRLERLKSLLLALGPSAATDGQPDQQFPGSITGSIPVLEDLDPLDGIREALLTSRDSARRDG